MARAGGCLAGILGGSILRGIVKAIGIIFKAIVNILVFTGLWIPGIYALAGFILQLTGTLNPSGSSMESILFKAGFGVTVLISILVTFKNIFAPSKRRKQKRELKKQEKQAVKKEREKEKRPSYDYNTKEPENIGFDSPPAPFDNYSSKLSRKEKRKIKKISKEAKSEAVFSDDNLKNPIESNFEEPNINSPIYVATVQNGKVVYTPIVNMPPPQEMPFNPNMHTPPQEMPFNPNMQMPPQEMPFNPNMQRAPQPIPYDNTINMPYSHIPYQPETHNLNQNNSYYQQQNTNLNNYNRINPESGYTKPHSTNKEEPKIYLSKVESNTLIHEYEDRFEVYKMKDGKAVKDRVEYKRNFS